VFWISPGWTMAVNTRATAAMVYTMIAMRPKGPDDLDVLMA